MKMTAPTRHVVNAGLSLFAALNVGRPVSNNVAIWAGVFPSVSVYVPKHPVVEGAVVLEVLASRLPEGLAVEQHINDVMQLMVLMVEREATSMGLTAAP
jgi:hypothetical protein